MAELFQNLLSDPDTVFSIVHHIGLLSGVFIGCLLMLVLLYLSVSIDFIKEKIADLREKRETEKENS